MQFSFDYFKSTINGPKRQKLPPSQSNTLHANVNILPCEKMPESGNRIKIIYGRLFSLIWLGYCCINVISIVML